MPESLPLSSDLLSATEQGPSTSKTILTQKAQRNQMPCPWIYAATITQPTTPAMRGAMMCLAKIPRWCGSKRAWRRCSAKKARVFQSTTGSAHDLQSAGLRRITINAAYWGVGMEFAISPTRSVDIVGKLLGLMPKLRAATADSEKATLQNAVTTTDQQIDALVYDLYGLTEDEIKLLEGNA
jgi:hypothetical protein